MPRYWPDEWSKDMQRLFYTLGHAEQSRRDYQYFSACWELDDGKTMLGLANWQLHTGPWPDRNIRNIKGGMRRLLVDKGFIEKIWHGRKTEYVFTRAGVDEIAAVAPPAQNPDVRLPERVNIKRHDAEWNI